MSLVRILTPFSRPEYADFLRRNVSQADVWVPIVTAEQERRFGAAFGPGLCVVPDPPPDQDICYAKINAWIDAYGDTVGDDDTTMFLCDDDALSEGLVERLRGYQEDILVISCKRGDQVPPEGPQHPNWPLVASPDNMLTCRCTWEQAILKGRILKQMRFNARNSCADGEMMEWLKAVHGDRIRYLPDLFVKFNYLQPGRWHS